MTAMTRTTLLEAVASRSDSAGLAWTIRWASVLFVVALTAAAAQISVPLPFTQIPFTFQPMVVVLGGLALGSRLGSAAQIAYLAAGVVGLPVFAASVTLPPGALRLLGPTGGYLMAYPLAALVAGLLAERGMDRKYWTSVLAMAAGLGIVYVCGATWLGFFARVGAENTAIGFNAAVMTGVVPFIAADVAKLAFAAAIVPAMWRLIGRHTPR